MLGTKSIEKKWNGVRCAILNTMVWESLLRKWHLSKDLKEVSKPCDYLKEEFLQREKWNTKVLQWEHTKLASVARA